MLFLKCIAVVGSILLCGLLALGCFVEEPRTQRNSDSLSLEQLRALAHHGDRTFGLTAETAVPIFRPDTPIAVEETEIPMTSIDQTQTATDDGGKTSGEDIKRRRLSTMSVIGRKPRRTTVLAENRDFFQIFRYGE